MTVSEVARAFADDIGEAIPEEDQDRLRALSPRSRFRQIVPPQKRYQVILHGSAGRGEPAAYRGYPVVFENEDVGDRDASNGTDEAVVIGLWQAGELSTRAAAERLRLTYRAFLDLLEVHEVPVLHGEKDPGGVQGLEEGRGPLGGS